IAGYREALHPAGIEPHVVVDEAFSAVGGTRAAEKMLADGYPATAICAPNDLRAIGVMQALRERGIDIPRDVAVVGFDDISAARLVTPPLTTVAQFQHPMGARAAEILLAQPHGN